MSIIAAMLLAEGALTRRWARAGTRTDVILLMAGALLLRLGARALSKEARGARTKKLSRSVRLKA
jgi:hypothetical protein